MTDKIDTPAFVTDEKILRSDLSLLRRIADRASCKLLYSPKASSLSGVLDGMSRSVDGFACSSPYELSLIDRFYGTGRSLHLVSPLIKPATLDAFGDRLDYLTFNSLSQMELLSKRISDGTNVGLRVNPQMSFVHDDRYDPCRRNSKLGIQIGRLAEIFDADPAALGGVSGLHIHNNCEETDFASLLATARHVQDVVPAILRRIDWINLGGGYLFDMADDMADFFEAVAIFRESFGLEVFIEPGAAVVRRCGTIEATVHDIIAGDDHPIAILDTTVNHMPEVFEFQFEPDILGHVDGGLHTYFLAGCTCLAGDVFGQYSFDSPLGIGSRITFLNMGAYTMSKAHRFNGVELPTIYVRRLDGDLEAGGAGNFNDYARDVGVTKIAIA